MAFFDKMKESVSMTGQKVSQKAKVATESMRITNQMKANDKMVEKLTCQVGIQCVGNHLYEDGTEYEELFLEIRRLKEENQTLQEELQKLSVSNTCPQCGFVNEQGARFCTGCGAPLAQEQEPAGSKICGKCGTGNEEDALFCRGCGSKLE